jgi:hypothetical protein
MVGTTKNHRTDPVSAYWLLVGLRERFSSAPSIPKPKALAMSWMTILRGARMVAKRTATSSGVKRPTLTPHKLRFSLSLGLGFCTLLTSGCGSMASLQDWNYKFTNKARARSAWHECYDLTARAKHGADFEAGFMAGFVDSSTGLDCRVPPVPPPKYWATKYQSCEGQTCIQNWFRGYQAGLASAESHGYPAFHQVPVSAQAPVLNRTACGTCYAPGPCSCSSAATTPHNFHISGQTAAESQAADPEHQPGKAAYETGVRTASMQLIGPSDLEAIRASHQQPALSPSTQNSN